MRLYIAFAHVNSNGSWGFGYTIISIVQRIVDTNEHIEAIMTSVKAAASPSTDSLIILNMQPLPIVSPGE